MVQVTLDGVISDSDSDEQLTGAIPTDPWCDDENPKVVKFESISAAAYKIRDGIVKTPCDVRQSIAHKKIFDAKMHDNVVASIDVQADSTGDACSCSSYNLFSSILMT